MRDDPRPHRIDRIVRLIAALLGREPKPAPAYAYARVRREAVDPRR